MNRVLARCTGLWMISCALVLLVGCGAGPVSVRGRIVDDNGTPIQKAEIATEPATDSVVSNSRGYFVLQTRITEEGDTAEIDPGKYRITVRKFGFKARSFVIPVKKGKNVIKKNIVMQERTPEIRELAPDQMEEQRVEPDGASVPKQGN